MSAPTRVRDLLDWAGSMLGPEHGGRLDAELLLAHALGIDRVRLIVSSGDEVAAGPAERYRQAVSRRAAGVPAAYLVEEREFWSLRLRVTPATLVPRPETELVVETALTLLPDGPATVTDLGTGSGAIALALAHERRSWHVIAADASAPALAVARDNATALGLGNVSFVETRWCDAFAAGSFVLIVSNPPYLGDQDPHLADDGLAFEPRSALVAGHDGLAAIAAITSASGACLRPGGHLVLEHGAGQGDEVRRLLAQAGFEAIVTRPDLAGQPRVSLGRWRGAETRHGAGEAVPAPEPRRHTLPDRSIAATE